MHRSSASLVLAFLVSCAAPELGTLRSDDTSPAQLARDARTLLALDRDEAIALLERHAVSDSASADTASAARAASPDFDRNERIGWLCRVVFVDAATLPVRAPRRGAVALPYLSMPEDKWPHFPLAIHDGCIFVLAEGLQLAGLPEPMSDYFAYLKREAQLSRALYAEPDVDAADRALQRLCESQRWREIRWGKDGTNPSYWFSEAAVRQSVRERF
jgi:hypothetical protein